MKIAKQERETTLVFGLSEGNRPNLFFLLDQIAFHHGAELQFFRLGFLPSRSLPSLKTQ